MATSHTQQKALNKLRITRPADPIATFFEALFPESTSISCRAPLLWEALALFDEQWSGADGDEVQVFAHNVVVYWTGRLPNEEPTLSAQKRLHPTPTSSRLR